MPTASGAGLVPPTSERRPLGTRTALITAVAAQDVRRGFSGRQCFLNPPRDGQDLSAPRRSPPLEHRPSKTQHDAFFDPTYSQLVNLPIGPFVSCSRNPWRPAVPKPIVLEPARFHLPAMSPACPKSSGKFFTTLRRWLERHGLQVRTNLPKLWVKPRQFATLPLFTLSIWELRLWLNQNSIPTRVVNRASIGVATAEARIDGYADRLETG